MAERMKALLVATSAFLLALVASIALAADDSTPVGLLDRAKTEKYILVASEMSRYPLPKTRPQVVVMSDNWFINNPCRGNPACNMYGLFLPSTPQYIFVRENTPPRMMQNMLVHEYVHYLQWASGIPLIGQSCEQRAALEAEAYVAAYRFELKYLPYNNGLDVTLSNCK